MELSGKKIVLSITGSIAAYKAVNLLRLLMKEGADVQVLLTPTAREFVGPVTFSALSGKPVLIDSFDEKGGDWNSHVDMGVNADLMLIAPATATTMGKMANGIADNLVIATYLAARCPVVFAPAMDVDMFEHPSTKRNIEILSSYGNLFIEPAEGELASGLLGKGRMEEPEKILQYIKDLHLVKKKKGLNKKVLITAGPTHEAIDPVRFIGNHSSGKMGYAIAETFANKGAEVILISGPVIMKTDTAGIKVVNVTSAQEMFYACQEHISDVDIAVFAAAVADFTPELAADQKIKRENDDLLIRLKPTQDIAASMGEIKSEGQVFVGFALETQDGLKNATSKLKRKNMDLIVLNSLQDTGAGFGTDTNKITMIDKSGNIDKFDLKPKSVVAEDIVEKTINLTRNA